MKQNKQHLRKEKPKHTDHRKEKRSYKVHEPDNSACYGVPAQSNIESM